MSKHTYEARCELCSHEQTVEDYGDWLCEKCTSKHVYDDEGHRAEITPLLRQAPAMYELLVHVRRLFDYRLMRDEDQNRWCQQMDAVLAAARGEAVFRIDTSHNSEASDDFLAPP